MMRGGNIFQYKRHERRRASRAFLMCITGVSGSGKSSFMYEILHKNLESRLERSKRNSLTYNAASFTGSEYLGRSILIDQSPIGRTPRRNPATYTGAWSHIRDMFAASSRSSRTRLGSRAFFF